MPCLQAQADRKAALATARAEHARALAEVKAQAVSRVKQLIAKVRPLTLEASLQQLVPLAISRTEPLQMIQVFVIWRHFQYMAYGNAQPMQT